MLYGSGNGTDDLLVIRGGVIAMVGDDPELVGATEIYRGKNGNIEIVDRIPRWEKYGFCFGRDTGTMQTDFYSGIIGERDQKKKVHVGINEWGDIVVVRDDDGAIPYNKKNGVGPLSGILNRSRY
ncbi:hypothetical protein [Nocardioides zeae]|uniref:Uncharacterized protein n=1 Tax=Nocardioides zeae TaxID=1457234 RepID=A0A6P0HMC5_9ACTN|nr:hypothetical protein [Nocardioides zeae]NEN79773.1 hypothetical protein [Nocardioides zeae]